MADDANDTLKKLVSSSGILFFGLVFQLGFGFLSRAIVARLVGKVPYGKISIGYTLLTALSIIAIIGTDKGISRYLPRFDALDHRRGVLVSAYQVIVPVSIAVGLAVAVFADPIATYVLRAPDAATVLRVFGLTIPFAAFVRLTVGTVRGMQHSLPRVYIQNVSLPLTRVILIVVVILLGFRTIGVAWAYAASYGIATVLCLAYLVRKTPLFADVKPKLRRRELFAFSAPLVVTAAMNLVLESIDIFLLSIFDTTAAVSVYSVAYPLAKLLTPLLMAFSFIFLPAISELHSNGEFQEMRRTYQLVSKWILFGTLPIFLVFAFFPATVIRYTFGPEYVSGALTLTVLSVGFLIHSFAGLNGNTLTSIGRVRTIMFDTIFAAVLNVVLNIILIPRYSYFGAAIATTISYILLNALFLVQLYRETGTHPFRRKSLVPSVAALLVWTILFVGLQPILGTLSLLLVEVGAFLVLYPLLILSLGGVEQEDIELLETLERRVGVDLGPVRRFAKQFVN
jgi:O-antigen/teichoic acid export membrane protein